MRVKFFDASRNYVQLQASFASCVVFYRLVPISSMLSHLNPGAKV